MCQQSEDVSRAYDFASAFPASLAGAVQEVTAILPPAGHDPYGADPVAVEGESVALPVRIYNPELMSDVAATLPAAQSEVLHCLYTRHHDGFVRQRHLRQIVTSESPWVVPYVVQLVGEYVLEILIDIREALSDLEAKDSGQQVRFGQFIAHNPDFFELTSQRVVSYWNCYYRYDYPSRSSYPGFPVLESLRAAAREQS